MHISLLVLSLAAIFYFNSPLTFCLIILLIIYPENCSIQIALVKTFNRFPYCTESRKVLSYCTGLRNVLSYCTGLRRGVPDRTTFAGWSP